MHDSLIIYVTYISAEFICCFVLFEILFRWYQNSWKIQFLVFRNLVLELLIHFFPFQVLTIVLMIFCEKHKNKRPEIPFQPRIWLAELTLLNALAIEVCKIMRLERVY